MACLNRRVTLAVVGILVVIIGLPASLLAIWVEGKYDPLPADEACPSFPANLTAFTFKKSIWSQWHWEYDASSPGLSGSIIQRCPSVTHDAEVHLSGKTAGRTDGKILTLISKTDVLDCHGDRVFITETGSPWQTIINSNNIVVSYLIYDTKGTILAYVDGTYFINDNILILDYATGQNVAKLYRSKLTVSAWQWDITIYQTGHPAANGVLLSLIAGQRSFSETPKSTDICNSYFVNVGWVMVAIACVIGVVIAVVVYQLCRRWRDGNSGSYSLI